MCCCTSLYVDVRRCTSLYVDVRCCTPLYVVVRHCTSLYVVVRRYTSLYVAVRRCTSLFAVVCCFTSYVVRCMLLYVIAHCCTLLYVVVRCCTLLYVVVRCCMLLYVVELCCNSLYTLNIARSSPSYEFTAVSLSCRRFGTKCGGCSLGISPNDLVRRARNKVFHLKCLTCVMCRKQLSTGEELYVIDENRFICKEDYLTSRYGSTGEFCCIILYLYTHSYKFVGPIKQS